MDEVSVMNNEYDTTQYIVINIGDEQYGIDIKYVDNIVHIVNMDWKYLVIIFWEEELFSVV